MMITDNQLNQIFIHKDGLREYIMFLDKGVEIQERYFYATNLKEAKLLAREFVARFLGSKYRLRSVHVA
jgi:hypothetical protein